MNSLEEIYNKTPKFSDFSSHYMERLYMLSHTIPTESLNRSIELILKTARSNGVIYCLGNGGSSSTAEHFANDISMCPENSLYNLKAISLTSNIALYSAIANDHGFENVFAIQLQKFLRPQDLVVAFSASGNSSNIINAFEYAKELGCPSLGICGFDGGLKRFI